jgi:hypothetical protein
VPSALGASSFRQEALGCVVFVGEFHSDEFSGFAVMTYYCTQTSEFFCHFFKANCLGSVYDFLQCFPSDESWPEEAPNSPVDFSKSGSVGGFCDGSHANQEND